MAVGEKSLQVIQCLNWAAEKLVMACTVICIAPYMAHMYANDVSMYLQF